MITKNTSNKEQIQMVSLEQLVPKDHILRKIDDTIDFSFIYDLVEDKYSSDTGRPSIDPVILIKIPIIQYMFGIKSMRQTIREIEVNVAYFLFQTYISASLGVTFSNFLRFALEILLSTVE